MPGLIAQVYANEALQGEARQAGGQYHWNLRTKGMSAGPLLIRFASKTAPSTPSS